MELTVVLCNDSDCSRPNQTALLSAVVCSQDRAGYFLFDLKCSLVFYERINVDSEKMHQHYKAPLFFCVFQYNIGFQHSLALCSVRSEHMHQPDIFFFT